MKTKTTMETAIICAAVVAVVLIVSVSFISTSGGISGKGFGVMGAACLVGLGLVLGYRYLASRQRARLELTGGEQYRRLAEEYRRLSDLAITAQEHTDLKLGDVSAQLDYLREQVDSLQKILKEVE